MHPQPAIFEEHEVRRVYDEATQICVILGDRHSAGADAAAGLPNGA